MEELRRANRGGRCDGDASRSRALVGDWTRIGRFLAGKVSLSDPYSASNATVVYRHGEYGAAAVTETVFESVEALRHAQGL